MFAGGRKYLDHCVGFMPLASCVRIAIATLAFYLSFPLPAISSCLEYAQKRLVLSDILKSWDNRNPKLASGSALNLGVHAYQTSDPSFVLKATIEKPFGVTDDSWRGAFYVVLLRPNGPAILADTIRLPVDASQHEITISANKQPSGLFRQSWGVNILACIGSPGEFDAFGFTTVSVIGVEQGIVAGLLSALFIVTILAFAVAHTSRRQLLYLYRRYRSKGYNRISARILLLVRRFSPAFVSQDAFGVASLGRFQVLLFTTCIIGVYAYAYAMTSDLPIMSNSVLALLGISLAGSSLARFTEAPILTTANRIWLMSTGAIERSPRLPHWYDFLAGEGEVDVTRVQALAFSIFSAIALVITGASDLAHFSIPEQVNYLLGLSQTIYVAGKAVPKESVKRLNDEIQTTRNAETALLSEASRENPAARTTFYSAKVALSATLADVFGERFNARGFTAYEPGSRLSTGGGRG